MKVAVKRLISLIMCFMIVFVTVSVSVSAATQSQLQNDINKLQQQSNEIQKEINALKSKKSDEKAILTAVQKKIANIQAQINRCNQEIGSINSKIAQNKAEIDEKNAEIEANKLAFKKRIRAIYMSNSDSSVKILLGAKDFSQYLQLSKLTSAVSSHDKAIIEDIVAAIDVLNQRKAENEKLLESQVSIRQTILAQQAELKSQEAEAQSLYNKTDSEQKQAEGDKAAVEKQIRNLQRQLIESFGDVLNGSFINPNTGLMWPCPYTRNISSGWGNRSGGFHYGFDISRSGILGQPVVAIADGVVYQTSTGCNHFNNISDRCGSGFGNHVRIDHGIMTMNGKQKVVGAIYGHMSSVAVSPGQTVKQGQVIGYVGSSGSSSGPHLHLTLLIGGKDTHANAVNPALYF